MVSGSRQDTATRLMSGKKSVLQIEILIKMGGHFGPPLQGPTYRVIKKKGLSF